MDLLRFKSCYHTITQIFDSFLFRKLFPDVIRAAYHLIIDKTKQYLNKELPSTGLRPHFSVAVDKSTPHRDTNHAVLIIIPVKGVRVAIPIDAPIVYSIDKSGEVIGGYGVDLADQILSVMKERIGFEGDDLCFIRGNV